MTKSPLRANSVAKRNWQHTIGNTQLGGPNWEGDAPADLCMDGSLPGFQLGGSLALPNLCLALPIYPSSSPLRPAFHFHAVYPFSSASLREAFF